MKTKHYFRFKDNKAQPEGTRDEVLKAIEIIPTTYPQDIQLNVEIGIVYWEVLESQDLHLTELPFPLHHNSVEEKLKI